MAGIGFSLRRLFDKRGILNLCRAYGYAGIITVGPMLMGIVMIAGTAFASQIGGLGEADRQLLNCMITYSLLGSLVLSGWFNMVVTRYTSDRLYEQQDSRVMPCFHGATAIMLVIGLVVGAVFFFFSGATFLQGLLCLWLCAVLIITWNEMIFLTAIKDYKAILTSFAAAMLAGFLVVLFFIFIGFVSIESMLLSVVIDYGIMACRFYKLLLDYFPDEEGSCFSFLRWIDRYRRLVIAGGLLTLGLYLHLVIMYFGPLQVQVKGLFYGAPQYDVSALFAFLSILITTINFVTSAEVRLYPKYSTYYGLFNENGSIRDIENAENEMLIVLRRELLHLGNKQIFTTLLFIVIGTSVLKNLPLGMTTLSLGIFRFLCVGYAAYAIGNAVYLMLLYFEDYTGACIASVLFCFTASAGTLFQALFTDPKYFGLGFIAGAMLFLVFCIFRLQYYTRRLPYYLLSRQSVIPEPEKGLFVSLAERLEEKYEKKKEGLPANETA